MAIASPFEQSALFEHRFWMQVLGDHARFIATALAPQEMDEFRHSVYFIQVFDRLLEESRKDIAGSDVIKLCHSSFNYALEMRDYKLHLIVRHLTGQLNISLSPSFINHMVNELEEFLRIDSCLKEGREAPRCHPIHHHLLWLQDASGHASAISSQLDEVEKRLIEKSREFGLHFEDLYLKAVELAGYMRTRLERFPSLNRFNRQVELEMALFMQFLHEMEEMEMDRSVLGILSPLILDHMYREECYYLTKLAEVTEAKSPDCDPTKPRVPSNP